MQRSGQQVTSRYVQMRVVQCQPDSTVVADFDARCPQIEWEAALEPAQRDQITGAAHHGAE